MKTYFAFVDDAGAYRQERSQTFLSRNPYFIKACVMIPSEKWKFLATQRDALLQRHTGQCLAELKWNHIWKLRRRDILNRDISYRSTEQFLNKVSYQSAYDYAQEMLGQLPNLDAKIVCTVTPNCVFPSRVSEVNVEKMHIQDIMQRIEMEVASQDPTDGLALLFCDQMSGENHETNLRETYHELYCRGDFIATYRHIVDSICFLSSHQSCGIQLADFVAGAMNGFLRGYDLSERMFVLRIYAHLRQRRNGNAIGYGIVEVPKRPESRAHLEEKFKTGFSEHGIAEYEDIPF